MASQNNTISRTLSEFVKLHSDTLQILIALTEATTSNKEVVEVNNYVGEQLITFRIPSFMFLNTKIQNLENVIQTLLASDKNKPIIFDNKPLPAIKMDNIDLPPYLEMAYQKTNWYYENFYNPLIYIKLDFDELIKNLNINPNVNEVITKRVVIKKVDLNSTKTNELITKYSSNPNNIKYEDLITFLSSKAIIYNEDSEVKKLTPITILNEGEFIINNISRVKENNVNYDIITLNTLLFKNIKDNVDIQLAPNDRLVCKSNVYIINSIDVSNKSVKLIREQGIDTDINVTDKMYLVNDVSHSKEIEISIGAKEYCFIFIKPIDPINEIVSAQFGKGMFLNNDDLLIMDGEEYKTIGSFYDSKVSDFSIILDGLIKDGYQPIYNMDLATKPIITNTSIVQTNSHISLLEANILITDFNTKYNQYMQAIKNNADNVSALKDQLLTKETALLDIIKRVEEPKYSVLYKLPISKYNNKNVIRYKIKYRYKSTSSTISDGPWITFETTQREKNKGVLEEITDSSNFNKVYIPISNIEKIEMQFKVIYENNLYSEWSDLIIVDGSTNITLSGNNIIIDSLNLALSELWSVKLNNDLYEKYLDMKATLKSHEDAIAELQADINNLQ